MSAGTAPAGVASCTGRSEREAAGAAGALRPRRDPLRRARVVRDAAELVRQPELALRPDPGARGGTHDDRRRPLPDQRRGVLQGPLVLGAGPGAGDVLAPLLRGAESRRSAAARARIAGAAWGRRDHRLHRLVGQRAAGPDPDAARVARRRPLRAGVRRGRGGDGRARHDGPALLDAAVLARLHRDARVRGVRADDARARRPAARAGGTSSTRARRACSSATRSPRSTRSRSWRSCSASTCCRGATR